METEIIGKSIVVFFERALKVGLKPHDPNRRELVIIADLTPTHESVGILGVGAGKAGNMDSVVIRDVGRHRNIGDVKVGFNIAHAGTGIHANVPTGPVIDGRGCWRRYPHISRKGGRSNQSSDGDNAGCQLLHVSPPKTGRIYHAACWWVVAA